MLSEKVDMDEEAEKAYSSVKINKWKSQLNKVDTPAGGALTPCDNSQAQQEDKILSFPGKDSANKKPWTLHLL